MSDQQTKRTILLEVEAKMAGVRENIQGLQKDLDQLLVKQLQMRGANQQNSTEYIELQSQIRNTRQAIREHNRELDAANRSFNAANNSIAQNRALVNTLTAEYIRLSQAEGATSEKTIQMRDRIRQLTDTLKAQEKAIGDTRRNVGNYHADIVSAISGITGSIPGLQTATQSVVKVVGFLPQAANTMSTAFGKATTSINNFLGGNGQGPTVIQGFQQFSQSAQTAAQSVESTAASLESVAPAAAEAEGGIAAVGAGSIATGGAIAALVVVIAGAMEWFSRLGSVALKSGQIFNGVKDAAASFFNGLQQGHSMDKLIDDMKTAYNGGVDLKKAMQDLDYQKQADQVLQSYNDAQINIKMQQLRNKKLTLKEAMDLSDEIGRLDEQADKTEQRNLRAEYEMTAQQSINAKVLNEDRRNEILKTLRTWDLAAIQSLEKSDQIDKGTSEKLGDIMMRYNKFIESNGMLDAKLANRMTIIKQRFGKDADQYAKDKAKEMADANAGLAAAENERISSLERLRRFTMSEFGKELAQTDQHYKQLIYKQQQFIASMEKGASLAKSPEAKARFEQAAAKGREVIKQIDQEWGGAINNLITNNSDKMAVLIDSAQNELHEALINNIKDTIEREIEATQLQADIQHKANEREIAERNEQIQRLKNDAATASKDEQAALLKQAEDLEAINAAHNQRDIAEAQAAADKIAEIKRKANDEMIEWLNQQAVLRQTQGTKGYYEALIKQVKARADKEIAAANANGPDPTTGLMADTSGIRAGANREVEALEKQKVFAKKQFEIDVAQQTANATFDIFSNNIQRQADLQMRMLEKQKAAELQNKSLSSAQRANIEEKYAKKEAEIKRKAFNQQKEIDVIRAMMNGALAITAAWTNPFTAPFTIPTIIATTAIEAGFIAAQKPPAYATGGLHYNSDGKGSLLRGPGTGTSDSMNARLSNGEAIINAKSTSMFAPLLSAINQAGGGKAFAGGSAGQWFTPGFASGGVYNSYTPTSDNGLRQQIVNYYGNDNPRIHPEDINAIAKSVASVTVIADVKDINYQQERHAKAYDSLAK